MSKDRRNHRRVERHGQREIASDAHPDCADASAANLLMNVSRKRAKPVGDRAGAVFRKHMPFPADAQPRQLAHANELVSGFSDNAEQMRHVDGEACIDDFPGEARNFRGDAGHLVHDDDARPLAFDKDRSFLPKRREGLCCEVGERVHRRVNAQPADQPRRRVCNGRFRPIADIRWQCQSRLMDKRGAIVTVMGLALLLALMFYGGMFMHGDP